MTDYDKAARYLVKRDPAGFFRWLFGVRRVVFHGWIDARRLALPDQGDLTSDLVAALRVGDAFEAYCVEIQAESDETSAGRVVYGYGARLRSEPAAPGSLTLRAVGGVVVNLTGPERTATVQERPTLTPRCRLDASVDQRTLRTQPAAELIRQVGEGSASRWLLSWLPLHRGGVDADTMAGWKREAAHLTTERDRDILANLTLTFADLAGNRAAWQRELEGWTMLKSPYMEELRIKERKEGREEGRVEGRLNEARAMLLRLARKKFGRAPTKKQQAELDAITDLARLEALGEVLLDVSSWGELLATP
jgi:hypothetical protein